FQPALPARPSCAHARHPPRRAASPRALGPGAGARSRATSSGSWGRGRWASRPSPLCPGPPTAPSGPRRRTPRHSHPPRAPRSHADDAGSSACVSLCLCCPMWRFLVMATSWLKRLRKWKSRPAGRRRPARARLGIEALEAREVPTVFAGVNGFGQLVVSTDNSDDVTIDHTVTALGPTTLVNGSQFPDAEISSIQVQGGFTHVNILATVKALTADGELVVNVGKISGTTNTGTLQRILAPLSLGVDGGVTLDDSNDPTGRNVTLNVVNEVGSVTNMS